MPEAAEKSKKIAKKGPGRQVRLWVRAKFLSFRRYLLFNLGPRLHSTPIKLSCVWRVSTTTRLPNITTVKELLTFTRNILAKPKTDSEYISPHADNLGTYQSQPRQHWSCFGSLRHQPSRQSHRFNPQSNVVPSKGLILSYLKHYSITKSKKMFILILKLSSQIMHFFLIVFFFHIIRS